jgi:hypothetical protein
MAVIRLYRGGDPIVTFPNCDGSALWDCPSTYRIDAVYRRGHFTASAIFNPVVDPRAMNAEYRDAKMVQAVAVNDVIEMFVIPPRHKITDVAVEVDLHMNSGLFDPAVGFTFDVVARHYEGAASCEPTSTETLFTAVNGAVAGWQHTDFVHLTNTEERTVLAIVVKTLPTTPGYTLADMQNYVALIASVIDFDAQRQM